jgi:hypothetical protein
MMRGKFTKIVWRESQKIIAVISLMSNTLFFGEMCTGVERRLEIHCLMLDFLEFIVITVNGRHENFILQ